MLAKTDYKNYLVIYGCGHTRQFVTLTHQNAYFVLVKEGANVSNFAKEIENYVGPLRKGVATGRYKLEPFKLDIMSECDCSMWACKSCETICQPVVFFESIENKEISDIRKGINGFFWIILFFFSLLFILCLFM